MSAEWLLTIDKGCLVKVEGAGADRLLNILGDSKSRSAAEFEIGTNRWVRITGNVLEDEKVYLRYGSHCIRK
ncbi:hypothetical protein EWI07_03045 [Sporolactobacillus sp. THM7-4]|nr:hypothetical protein EWI07_03045 [Sporolactobacillus sp. THM7-4]